MEKHPLHLKNPELQKSEEVNDAVEKHERLSGERVPNDPSARIDTYTDRLESIFLNKDERVRERNIDILRDKIYGSLLIKKENFPESYFELQKRVARERGEHIEEIPENIKDQMMEVAIADQKASLDAWIDYLSSDDAVYPAWFKYYIWKNITKLSQFDKERGEFKKRTESTVAPYPDIYREPLAQLADIYEKVKEDNKVLKDEEIQSLFSQKFPSAYAELIQKSLASKIENQEEVRGEWVKYNHGKREDALKLYQSLENKGTGWCTAGRSTAETQVESGDFYVYYTFDSDNNPTQPRIAIRMQGNHIAEVRGILPHQSLEPQMQEILEEKLQEFGPEADTYKKKSEDMKHLTLLERKQEKGEEFSRDDLVFLYEIDSPIEGFGYEEDPRVGEMRKRRNLEEDAPIVLDCKPSEIAHSKKEITDKTKGYIGPLFEGVFNLSLDNIYTSFPEGAIKKYNIEIGGKTKTEIEAELKEQKVYVSDYAKDILNSPDFKTSKNTEHASLVRLTVGALGFPHGATTDEIYQKAEKLGLELCPPDVGPHLRLSYSGNDWMLVAMKQITDRDGDPDVWSLDSDAGGLELRAGNARSDSRWSADNEFVFRLRKKL